MRSVYVKYLLIIGLLLVFISAGGCKTGGKKTTGSYSSGHISVKSYYKNKKFNNREYRKGLKNIGNHTLAWKKSSANLSKYKTAYFKKFSSRLIPPNRNKKFSRRSYVKRLNMKFKQFLGYKIKKFSYTSWKIC